MDSLPTPKIAASIVVPSLFVLSFANAQEEQANEPKFSLPQAYVSATDSTAKELAKPLLVGLRALDEGQDVRLIEVVKILRASGFSTQKSDRSSRPAHDALSSAGARRLESDTASPEARGGHGGHGGGVDPQSRFESMDSDGDGVLKGAEIGPRMQGSERAKDNVVTLEEFKAAWEEMFGRGNGNGRHGEGNGRHGGGGHARGSELGRRGRGASTRPANGDAEFLLGLDQNRDRTLTVDEVLAGVRADLIANMVETIQKDSDNDGRITLEEYAGQAERSRRTEFMFARRDTNGDKSLSPAEVVEQAAMSSKPRLLAIGACLAVATQGKAKITSEELASALSNVAADVDKQKFKQFAKSASSTRPEELYPTLYRVVTTTVGTSKGNRGNRGAGGEPAANQP